MAAKAEKVICPYCGTPSDSPVSGSISGRRTGVCPSCRTPHHLECWDANRGCTTLGCPHSPRTPGFTRASLENVHTIEGAVLEQLDGTSSRAPVPVSDPREIGSHRLSSGPAANSVYAPRQTEVDRSGLTPYASQARLAVQRLTAARKGFPVKPVLRWLFELSVIFAMVTLGGFLETYREGGPREYRDTANILQRVVLYAVLLGAPLVSMSERNPILGVAAGAALGTGLLIGLGVGLATVSVSYPSGHVSGLVFSAILAGIVSAVIGGVAGCVGYAISLVVRALRR